MNARWIRRLGIVAAVAFLTSLTFPIAAGLSHNTKSLPRWWGPMDVAWSFFLGLLVLAVFALAKGKATQHVEAITYRAYRALIHVIFAALLLFFLAGNRIVWINCLTGFAWRFWLLLYSLPTWIAVFSEQEDHRVTISR